MKIKIFTGFCLISLFSLINTAKAQTKAYVKISVNVEGVSVTIDDKPYGLINPIEPLIKETTAGYHKITASKYSYETQIREVTLAPNEINEVVFQLARPEKWEVEKKIQSNTLGVVYGSLTVVVKNYGKPVSAGVTIDNRFADYAPLSVKRLLVGEHTIKIEYNSLIKYRNVVIEKNTTKFLELEMQSVSNVEMTTTQDSVTVVFENGDIYALPYNVKLSKGKYIYKFQKNGQLTSEREIEVDGDSDYALEVFLSRSLPVVTLNDVGRKTQTYHQLYEYQVTVRTEKNEIGGTIGGIVGLVGGVIYGIAKGAKAGEVTVGCVLTTGLGIAIGDIFNPTTNNRDDIEYNEKEAPKRLREANALVDEYNRQTERLIENERLRRYSVKAATINIK